MRKKRTLSKGWGRSLKEKKGVTKPQTPLIIKSGVLWQTLLSMNLYEQDHMSRIMASLVMPLRRAIYKN